MDGTEFDWDSFYCQGNIREEEVNSITLGTNQGNSAPNNEIPTAPAMSVASAIRLATGNNNDQVDCSSQLNESLSHQYISSVQPTIKGLRNLGDCVVSSPVYPVQTRDGVGVFISGLNVVAGPQGSSKSTIIRKIIADITNPSETSTFIAEGGISAKAIVLAKEDDENSIYSPEIIANGGNPRNINYLIDREWQSKWIAEVEGYLALNPNCKIVLVDTIEAFAAKLGYSKITSKVVRLILDPLSELGKRYRVAIVATCHLTKRQANHILDRIAGSVELTGSARLVYSVAPHGQDSRLRVMESAKSNQRGHLETLVYEAELIPLEDGIRMAINLGIRVDNGLTPDTFVRVNIVADDPEEDLGSPTEEPITVPPQRRESESSRCAIWIQTLLAERNVSIATNELNQLATTNGFSPSTVTNARTILRNENLVESHKRDGRSWLVLRRASSSYATTPSATPDPLAAPSISTDS